MANLSQIPMRLSLVAGLVVIGLGLFAVTAWDLPRWLNWVLLALSFVVLSLLAREQWTARRPVVKDRR